MGFCRTYRALQDIFYYFIKIFLLFLKIDFYLYKGLYFYKGKYKENLILKIIKILLSNNKNIQAYSCRA